MEGKREIAITINSRKTLILALISALTIFVITSYIMALYAFDAPSEDFPLKIINLETLNASNMPQTTFIQGDTVKFNVTIEKALRYRNFPWTYDYYDFIGVTNFRIIIRVKNANNEPIPINSTLSSISPGEFTIELVNLPNSTPGSYTARVLVWSDWLPSGKALAPDIMEVSYDVA